MCSQLRDWLHVIASSKTAYELRYYNIHEQDAEEDEEKANFMRSVQTKLKILLAVIQIQNALPWTLPFVSYPEPFEALVAWMSFIELDFVRIVPMSFARFRNSAVTTSLPNTAAPRKRSGRRTTTRKRRRRSRCRGA